MAALPPLTSPFRVPPPKPGDRPSLLAGYELLNELAVGEFCTVHRARPLALAAAKDVVVKRLRSSHRDAYGRARLLREARVGLTLHAPNLVRVLEVHDEPEPFLVMEYVAGVSLRGLLTHADGLDAALVAPVIVDVLRGLSALHGHRDEQGAAHPLVHQAPSARHMLLGADGVTRLIDLASVHQRGLGSTESVGRRFLHGEVAPEQLLPRVKLDARCDLFIVGKALERALEQACTRGEVSLRARCAPLFAIVARACAEAREERFASADELAEQLEDAAERTGLFASREQLAARVRQICGDELRVPPVPAPASVHPLPRPLPGGEGTQAVGGHVHAHVEGGGVVGSQPVAAFAAPRNSQVSAQLPPSPLDFAPAARNSWRSVVLVAGSVALLTSLLTLGVRGLQHAPPSASAARLALDRAGPPQAPSQPGSVVPPTVTPLALAPRRRAALRDHAAVPAPKPPRALPLETDARAEETFETSDVASIAAAIRDSEARRPRAVARPRLLRVELPDNPY